MAWSGKFVLLGWLAGPVHGQGACPGDCDGGDTAGISELVTCVGLSLGTSNSDCTACDVDQDGMVEINELILAVNASLCGCPGCTARPTPTPGSGAICGNGTVDAGEDCDDGPTSVCVGGSNAGTACEDDADCTGGACKGPFGGDGCAGNCTTENTLVGTFDTMKTSATVQFGGGQIPVMLSGGQTFRAGKQRDEVVMGPGNRVLFQSGEIPVVIKAKELLFNPVSVSTVACACVRGVPQPALLGPGNAAMGVIGCGTQGLTDINYRVVQDHNTNPGDPNNACGTTDGAAADDDSCTAAASVSVPGSPNGMTAMSTACRERGTDDRCNNPVNFIHPGVCNSPRILTRSGGTAPRGSTFMLNSTSISLLMDGGKCGAPGAPCIAGYGQDCKPCTNDDLDILTPNVLPTTSGIAESVVYDLNNGENFPGECGRIDVDLGPEAGGFCSGIVADGCVTRVTGSKVDCSLLPDSSALQGASLVVAFPSIDTNLIKDTVTTTTFFNK